jgi:hypothetical protein
LLFRGNTATVFVVTDGQQTLSVTSSLKKKPPWSRQGYGGGGGGVEVVQGGLEYRDVGIHAGL